MIILSIKTDQAESEFGLYKDNEPLSHVKYMAHKNLGVTIHSKIQDLLKKQSLDFSDINGVVCFKGPGSFTGLRIGITVANTLAYSLNIPIIGTTGHNWMLEAIAKLLKGEDDKRLIPFYGAKPNITKPKK